MKSRFKYSLLFLHLVITTVTLSQVPKKGDKLPNWQAGYLDLHHINTGRGSCAYYILPDGTTILFDAGEEDPTSARTKSARNSVIRPDSTKQPYEWIANYIRQVAPTDRTPKLNYAIISHFHEDHMGGWYNNAPKSKNGDFILSGITGVDELIPIDLLLDRGYPLYNFPVDTRSKAYEERLLKMPEGSRYLKSWNNYLHFIEERDKAKRSTAQLKSGSRTQIKLAYHPDTYKSFFVQNIKSNEKIWNGKDTGTINQFPSYNVNDPATYPSENALSQVILIGYGNFRYYTGGDIPGNVQYGQQQWMDVETPVAKVVGRVDVATMDHHGNRDAVNENMVRTFQPRVWLEQSWSSDHPGHEVLIRATSQYLYKGPRDLFTTNMLQPNRDVIGPLIDNSYKSQQGHILVRVLPGGGSYYVIILDDSVAELRVKEVFGPYESQEAR